MADRAPHPCIHRVALLLVLAAGLVVLSPAPDAYAQSADKSCAPEDVSKAVNSAGAELRRVNGEALPRLRLKMQALRERKGWSEAEYEYEAMQLVGDERTAEFDREANAHLERIDVLSRAPVEGATDCAVVAEIRARAIELVATVRAKSEHALQRLDQAIAASAPQRAAVEAPVIEPKPAGAAPPRPAAATQAPAPPRGPAAPSGSAPAARTASAPATATAPSAAAPGATGVPPAVARKEPPPRPPAWQTTTAETSGSVGLAQPPAAATAPSPAGAAPTGADVYIVPSDADGYTIDEVREATRGFFGHISTGLASVIEHAFQKGGRPTAYVLGSEGGAAFLAGARYGDGTLYLRRGGQRRIYWHGPSVGGDVGLSGTKTMFLIYNLDSPEQIYSRFSGIDGSAFFVGGVGLTLLTNGRVIMAPIRSGVGFRLGASIGYLRFTESQTWNPF